MLTHSLLHIFPAVVAFLYKKAFQRLPYGMGPFLANCGAVHGVCSARACKLEPLQGRWTPPPPHRVAAGQGKNGTGARLNHYPSMDWNMQTLGRTMPEAEHAAN